MGLETIKMKDLEGKAKNIYESIAVMAKRARHLNNKRLADKEEIMDGNDETEDRNRAARGPDSPGADGGCDRRTHRGIFFLRGAGPDRPSGHQPGSLCPRGPRRRRMAPRAGPTPP